jgi:predicted CXXCH cytochrome family protein
LRSIAPAALRKEVETCGLCHARAAEFSDDWVPGHSLLQTHIVPPVNPQLFYSDGQMLDGVETYNYVPFKQSAMFAAGVTCGDCHDPHSSKLRVSGDPVCLQCHEAQLASPAHTHHETASPPIGCVSCHMPVRTYMIVDRRHDHSFRIPRPDLSVKFSVPNACNDCHSDKPAQWTATAIERWFGPQRKGFQRYLEAFEAAEHEQPDSETLLPAIAEDRRAPAVARAGALTELAKYVSSSNIDLARSGLADQDPMVRIGALDMLARVPPIQVWPLVARLLKDPIRAVRIRAVSLLAPVPSKNQPAADQKAFADAAEEFVAAQRFNADRPEARATLGAFFARRAMFADAEAEYRAALRLEPQFAPAASNLADLYRQMGRNDEGIAVLQTATAASPNNAGLHHALGLALVRAKRLGDALDQLRQAVDVDAASPRYAYVYAVALHSAGRTEDAISILKSALVRHPSDRDILLALVSFNRDAGDLKTAIEYAQRLVKLSSGNGEVAALLDELRREMTNAAH